MDYKGLLRQIEITMREIESSEEAASTISNVARTIIKNFRDQLGLSGGRLYVLRDDQYELIQRVGTSSQNELGIQVPADYAPIAAAIENGVILMEPNDPAVDPDLERRLGARRFAAIAVGEDDEYIVSFNVATESPRDDVLFSLSLVRNAITQKLREKKYESILAEAQRIQHSILPQRGPVYAGYDIYGKTIPAETVSGDFYDFIPVSNTILGLAIADGSGHGLSAALVVRDIHMGLRMGVDRDFKIVRTLQKLNQIIHRSRLTTKFVSLFYGELELNGTFIYSNAGHNPPFLLLKQNRVEMLRHGGMILGPTPDATYQRGYVYLEPGDLLCLYTDGIVEAHDKNDREFGIDRLIRLVRKHRERSSQEISRIVLNASSDWAHGIEQDDRTIVIVKATDEKTG
ncbi:MAG: PP2C family protein-serine/threonine phosphatase [Thermoanaerobaculia bacterium]